MSRRLDIRQKAEIMLPVSAIKKDDRKFRVVAKRDDGCMQSSGGVNIAGCFSDRLDEHITENPLDFVAIINKSVEISNIFLYYTHGIALQEITNEGYQDKVSLNVSEIIADPKKWDEMITDYECSLWTVIYEPLEVYYSIDEEIICSKED